MNIRHWLFASILGAFCFSCSSSDPVSPGKNEEESPTELETYHYKLPVIFHVLYSNQADTTQYVKASTLQKVLENVNKYYSDTKNSIDMNLEFTLATTDEKGNKLSTPGVEYVKWNGMYPIDCYDIMYDNTRKYISYIWEPSDYINVMMYHFEKVAGVSGTVLGVSDMPFTPVGEYYLEGTNKSNYSTLTKKNLAYAYCSSINSSRFLVTPGSTNGGVKEVSETLAHELGHYLGLCHVFSEADNDTINGVIITKCEDTDYCADTPSYNKSEYEDNCQEIMKRPYATYAELYAELIKRTSCDNQTFISTNIMDYDYGYCNAFTPNQRSRVRHVLMYAPLMPGPKYDVSSKSRTERAPEGPVDLPIHVVE